jgi:hypothetical protein
VAALFAAGAAAQGFHQRAPILYRQAADDNAATILNARLAAGELKLPAEGRSGRLRALLEVLHVPASSQMLVFSKTSLQRHRISPQNPRALFYGPDAYVGWVPGAAALEVAVGDRRLGLVFYTLAQDPEQPAVLKRDDSCLSCHGGERTDDEPGLLLRSVFPDAVGDPIASAGEVDVTLRTPIAERWGGWIVTGRWSAEHRGNGIAERDEQGRYRVVGKQAADLAAYGGEFSLDGYPSRTSDVGALLAFEQQATVHNLLIRASLQARCLLDGDRALNEMLGETGVRPATARILDALARQIATTLLFADEASLAEAGAGADPAFAAAFAAQWPPGPSGQGLGRFDLQHRLFALPLSPMVHSPAFAALPDELRTAVLERLRVALQRGRLPGGVALTTAQRQALHEHLRATLPGY